MYVTVDTIESKLASITVEVSGLALSIGSETGRTTCYQVGNGGGVKGVVCLFACMIVIETETVIVVVIGILQKHGMWNMAAVIILA
jgi:hypothetical protein